MYSRCAFSRATRSSFCSTACPSWRGARTGGTGAATCRCWIGCGARSEGQSYTVTLRFDTALTVRARPAAFDGGASLRLGPRVT